MNSDLLKQNDHQLTSIFFENSSNVRRRWPVRYLVTTISSEALPENFVRVFRKIGTQPPQPQHKTTLRTEVDLSTWETNRRYSMSWMINKTITEF